MPDENCGPSPFYGILDSEKALDEKVRVWTVLLAGSVLNKASPGTIHP